MDSGMEQNEFIIAVLRLFDEMDSHESLWWRVYDNRVVFLINCNDWFAWGCADAEEITPDNLEVLSACMRDMPVDHEHMAYLLFCCRVRKMRPQGACYRSIHPDIRHLFDACGPARGTGFGNPKSQDVPYFMHEKKEATASDSHGP